MDTPARRQYVKWTYFKVDPAWRRLPANERKLGKDAFVQVAKQWAQQIVLRAYTLVGLRSDAEIGLWLVSERLEDLQEIQTQLMATPLGSYLTIAHSFFAMTKRSLYVDKYATDEEAKRRDIIVPGQNKYLFVYPFVKTRPWYALSAEDRQRLMDNHIRIGRKYPDVKLNTTYSYGLDDQEFVVAFETDNPSRFLDLVEELRFTEASQYTLRDTPLIPGIAITVEGMLDTLDGGSVSTAEPIEAASPAGVGAGVNGSGSGAAPTPNPQPPTASRADGFVEVAKVVDVSAGSSKLVVVNGEQIALYNVDGTFYALGNRCSHARGPLVDGTVCAGALGAKVECPWHGAEFDLQTGAALSRPARGPVPAYQVTLEGDAVLVGPQKTEADLQPKEQGQARELPARVDDQLDAVDKKLVNVMQHAFPVVSRPWQALAEEVGTTEVGVMQRITRLREIGVVRQISPIFDTRKLGYKSSLVAVRVAPERLEDAAAVINSHPGVSHNYRRDHYFNMWFTIAVPPDGDLDAEVQRLTERAGVEKVRMLPTLKMYKIAVKLNMEADETTLGKDNTPYIKAKDVRPLTERDKELIRATQDDMPLVEQPFKQLAEQAGITEDALFAWLNEMQQMNYLRRIAAILRHQKAGFTDNGMITWKVPEDKVDEAGRIAAAYPTVSHCYRRPVYEDWPYNFFSMVHARSRENAEEIGRQIAQELKPLGVTEYVILFSTKEFKKDRVRYFVDWNAQDAPAAATVAAK